MKNYMQIWSQKISKFSSTDYSQNTHGKWDLFEFTFFTSQFSHEFLLGDGHQPQEVLLQPVAPGVCLCLVMVMLLLLFLQFLILKFFYQKFSKIYIFYLFFQIFKIFYFSPLNYFLRNLWFIAPLFTVQSYAQKSQK